jgi:2-oxoisovalerate dehydrogenase E1 component
MTNMTGTIPKSKLSATTLLQAFRLMATAKTMAAIFEENAKFSSRYVHATSRGHEAIQLAVAMQLLPQDYLAPYYRDDAMLLGIGLRPLDLMLQLMAKREDPFSGGRTYYAHPSLKDPDKPLIPHQSSATGMQAIPAAGIAMGIRYKEQQGLMASADDKKPIVVCSLGDGAVTEGEVAEAFQAAALMQLPVLFVVQDNGWDISATAAETRAQDAAEYARGFHGLEAVRIDGSNFAQAYEAVEKIIATIRTERRPFLLHADVPLLNHHTSGVRSEWYRDDLEEHFRRDPYPILRRMLSERKSIGEKTLQDIEQEVLLQVQEAFELARQAEDPKAEEVFAHDFAPTPIVEEQGQRHRAGGAEVLMVDCALHAIEELMLRHPECLLYGQDVGGRLGGVFREAATLAGKFGAGRVFNTAIQEAFIVGSTVGMSAAGLRPIVEVQFADYIWPGLNQLFTEVSRSCYLSNGKWPVSMVLRVPIGAYGHGGPYHSSSVESVVTNIRGIKIVYPSNGADLKGLLKAAYYDPNPVVVFEHKGLYWSKVPGTETAKVVEPDEAYIVPLGKARIALSSTSTGNTLLVVTYGMGVHWALGAARSFPGQVEILDLRTLFPLDETLLYERARLHGRILVVTEEPVQNTFAQSIAARVQEYCFEYLDAPVRTIGAANLPAIPLNEALERAALPSTEKVATAIKSLLDY